MYGQYRNSGISHLRSYADALEWFNNVTPIKGSGRNAGIKPLGHRNRTWFQILKLSDDSIACRCYNSDLVTFHPDGVVTVKTDSWNSQTTANFISDVLGLHAGVHDHDVQLGVDGGMYRIKSGIKIKREGIGYKVVEAERHEVYLIDRKKMNEIRKKVKPFRDFMAGMIKLREGKFMQDEILEIVDRGTNWTLEIRTWRENAEHTLPRLKAFAHTIMGENVDGNWYRGGLTLLWSGESFWGSRIFSMATLDKKLTDLLIATHPEVLLVSLCEPGVSKKNAYARFKSYKELQR